MYDELIDVIERLPVPNDYFEGVGELSFPVPSDIMVFSRNKFEYNLLLTSNEMHYRYVFIVNFGDPLEMVIDGEAIELKTNCFIIILPFQYHRYYHHNQKNVSLFFLTFFLEENVFFEQFRHITFKYDTRFNSELRQLIEYYQYENILVLPYFTGYFLAKILSESEYHILVKKNNKVSKVILEICRNIYMNKKITIGEISETTQLSERYLRQIFKKTMGLTLGQYISEIKMYEAMKHLVLSEMSISEIAEKSGYDSIYTFSRAFKKSAGVSPSKYRLNKKY